MPVYIRKWNGLAQAVFESGLLGGFMGAVNYTVEVGACEGALVITFQTKKKAYFIFHTKNTTSFKICRN